MRVPPLMLSKCDFCSQIVKLDLGFKFSVSTPLTETKEKLNADHIEVESVGKDIVHQSE